MAADLVEDAVSLRTRGDRHDHTAPAAWPSRERPAAGGAGQHGPAARSGSTISLLATKQMEVMGERTPLATSTTFDFLRVAGSESPEGTLRAPRISVISAAERSLGERSSPRETEP